MTACILPTDPRFIDLSGRRVGRLRVLSFVRRTVHRDSLWLCMCDCGRRTTVTSGRLKAEKTKSCGCLRRSVCSAVHRKHGMAGTKIYRIWQGMIQRCTNPMHAHYRDYGGRGIAVCKRWVKFENFFADMSTCPPLHSLDRRNNDRGYSLANCRWATQKQQANNRRCVPRIAFDGLRLTVSEWADRLGLEAGTMRNRFKRWSIAEAILTPQMR